MIDFKTRYIQAGKRCACFGAHSITPMTFRKSSDESSASPKFPIIVCEIPSLPSQKLCRIEVRQKIR